MTTNHIADDLAEWQLCADYWRGRDDEMASYYEARCQQLLTEVEGEAA